jgi:hypothetical protein
MPNDTVRASGEAMPDKFSRSILNQAVVNANDLRLSVNILAGVLAEHMQIIHGGQYRIQIDHNPEAAFVAIVPRLDGPSPAPECGGGHAKGGAL